MGRRSAVLSADHQALHMNAGSCQRPWTVQGVSEQVREEMREAARREGMAVGDWLNRVLETTVEAARRQQMSVEDWVHTVRAGPPEVPSPTGVALGSRRYF